MGGPPTRGGPEMGSRPAPAAQRLSGLSNRDCYGTFTDLTTTVRFSRPALAGFLLNLLFHKQRKKRNPVVLCTAAFRA